MRGVLVTHQDCTQVRQSTAPTTGLPHGLPMPNIIKEYLSIMPVCSKTLVQYGTDNAHVFTVLLSKSSLKPDPVLLASMAWMRQGIKIPRPIIQVCTAFRVCSSKRCASNWAEENMTAERLVCAWYRFVARQRHKICVRHSCGLCQ